MTGRSPLIAALLLVAMCSGSTSAQQTPEALARDVEQRFEVLLLRDGVALRPKARIEGVTSIEVTAGSIALDGAPASGAEVRDRLGRDAAVVMQLSYLDGTALRALFAPAEPPAAPPAAPADPNPPLERPDSADAIEISGDDIVRIGSSITVEDNQDIRGDVVAVTGSVRVNGRVRGDVVAVMGSVDLGPRAVVDGNVAVVGGSLRRADGATVHGRVREVGLGAMTGDWVGRGTSWSRWTDGGRGSIFALFSTVTRLIVVSLLAVLVVLLASGYVEQIGSRAASEPVKAGAIGVLTQLLFLPLLIVTIIVLVVTIVLIPLLALLPFLVVGLVAAALVGFSAVTKQLGDRVARHFGWAPPSIYVATLTGIGVVFLPVLVARLALAAGGTGVSLLWHAVAFAGLCFEYLVWTVGFGAVALARFGKKPLWMAGSQPPTSVEG